MVRRGIGAALAVLIVVAITVATLPLVASTRIVRERIAFEMSLWSGFRVVMEQAPEIEVWPSFRAVLHDVRLLRWDQSGQTPVIHAERLEINLSALSALRGKVDFSKIRLVRPVIRIPVPAEPRTLVGGRIALAIDAARRALAENPAMPDTSALPASAFGTVEFVDGRIELDGLGEVQETVTGVEGNLSWPELAGRAALRASGNWRGEQVTMTASSPQPLVFLAGGIAPVALNLQGAPLSLSFDGTANLSESGFFEGAVDLSSPSLPRLLAWSRMSVVPKTAISTVALTGRLSGNSDRLKFADARIAINGNPGQGSLELSFIDAVPGVSGTLAFETIDLTSFLSAFTTMPSGLNEAEGRIDSTLSDQVQLDLRLSAANARAGGIDLADVAATTQVKGNMAVFDISDASVFSGTVQAGLRLDLSVPGGQAEFRLHASDIDSGAFDRAIHANLFMPHGPTTISLTLKSALADWRTMAGQAVGTLTAKFGKSSLMGADLDAFVTRANERGFFALSDLPQTSMALDSAELKATISQGIATLEKAQAQTDGRLVSVTGIVPFIARGVALTGTITEADASGEETADVFFVGGSWGAPFVTPVIPSQH